MTKKKKLILLIVCAALAILTAACAAAMLFLSGVLQAQKVDERWRGESKERFAQVSCFFPVGSEQSLDDIRSFRTRIDPKLVDAGLEIPEEGNLWTDAYSARGSVNVSGTRNSASAVATGVGGDFFVFHTLRLRSGSYISGDDLMGDRVVLDEELAWKLFGGLELEGLYVTIGDKPYYIAGVVERETDFASQKAYTDEAGLFMSYDALMELEASSGVNCYELVCADPISGYAKGIVAEGLSQNGKFPVIENSSRFSLDSLFGIISDFGARSMNNYGVIYPYWENAARLIEDYMALLLVFALTFAVLPALCLIIILVKMIKLAWAGTKHGAVKAVDKAQSISYEGRVRRHERGEKRKDAKNRVKQLEKSEKKRRAKAKSGKKTSEPEFTEPIPEDAKQASEPVEPIQENEPEPVTTDAEFWDSMPDFLWNE